MFLGHYGVALGTKRFAPRVSPGWLVFGAQFPDLLWPILLLLGIEHVRMVPGLMAANSLDFVSYPLSHSLLTVIGWSIVVGGVYFVFSQNRRNAWIIGALVLSHWLLDLPMHRPDLPLWPGSSIRVGLSAWNSIPLSLAIEGALLLVGLMLYLRSTRPRDAVGRWGLWAMVGLLVIFFVAGTFGPPPPSERALAITSLGLWLFVPWSHWVDRHRETRETPTGRRY